MSNNRTKAAVIGAALAGGAAFALLSPAAPALASGSGLDLVITVQSPATLVARGVAVDVTVDVTCNVQDPSAYVQLTERAGNWLVNGEGWLQLPACTGSPQRVVVRVMAQGDRPFARGTGLATATASGCDEIRGVCDDESASETIKITK
jgi:hypothetical protein